MPFLRVHLICARKLNGTDVGGKCDPYICVLLGDKKLKSKKKKKTKDPEYDETFHFELTDSEVTDLMIEAKDKDFIGRDDSLGVGSIPLSSIPTDGTESVILVRLEGGDLGENIGKALGQISTDVKQNVASSSAKKAPGGSFTNKLVDKASGKSKREGHALSGSRTNRGTVLVGVSIHDDIAEPVAGAPAPVYPTAGESFTLTCHVLSAANLNKADVNGSDPYCQLTVQNKKVKTKVLKKTCHPHWDQTLTLNVPNGGTDFLLVKVKDSDLLGSDDSLGEVKVHISDLAVGKTHTMALSLEGGSLGENIKAAAAQASADAQSAAAKKAATKAGGKLAGSIAGSLTSDKNKKPKQHALAGARTNHGVVSIRITLTPA